MNLLKYHRTLRLATTSMYLALYKQENYQNPKRMLAKNLTHVCTSSIEYLSKVFNLVSRDSRLLLFVPPVIIVD